MSRGLFFTFEGIDGCGKTTQAGLLFERLASRFGSDSVIWTREPGGWEGGPAKGRGRGGKSSDRTLFVEQKKREVESVIQAEEDDTVDLDR